MFIDGFPRWKIEQDLVTGTLTVTTGYMERDAIPTGGIVQNNVTGKAIVSVSRPDGARVEAEETFHIHMPTGEMVKIETKGWVSEKRTLLTGRVTVDGRVFFEKQWLR